jgi:hypothetical protein
MKNGIPYRNHSPYGWWIATYIIRASWDDEPNPASNKRCRAWENTIILEAPDREAAYTKAISIAKENCSEFEDYEKNNRKGRWVFEGFTSLMAIHEKIQDGAEIIWEDHPNRTVGKIRSWIKRKDQLETFDDTPAFGDS